MHEHRSVVIKNSTPVTLHTSHYGRGGALEEQHKLGTGARISVNGTHARHDVMVNVVEVPGSPEDTIHFQPEGPCSLLFPRNSLVHLHLGVSKDILIRR